LKGIVLYSVLAVCSIGSHSLHTTLVLVRQVFDCKRIDGIARAHVYLHLE